MQATNAQPLLRSMPHVPFGVVRLVLSATLLLAAALKTHELLTVPESLLTLSWSWTIALVHFEFLTALVILCSPLRVAKSVAFAVFAVFAIVAATRWAVGGTNCGCFGRLQMHPSKALAIDLLLLTLLASPRSTAEAIAGYNVGLQSRRTVAWLGSVATAWFLLALPLTVAVAAWHPRARTESGLIFGSGVVVMEPSEWLGRRLPLLEYIKGEAGLAVGRWKAVLYHHECPKCQELLAELNSRSSAVELEQSTLPLALIELPPFGSLSTIDPSFAALAVLDDRWEWYGPLPIQLQLSDGTVERVTSGP